MAEANKANVMLQKRFITAVIMAAIFLLAVSTLELIPMAALLLIVASGGAWEWAALASWEKPAARLMYALGVPLLAVTFWFLCDLGGQPSRSSVQPYIGFAVLLWSIAMLLVRGYPQGQWLWRHTIMRNLLGWLFLSLAWLSVVYLLTLDKGPLLLTLLIVLVVSADVGAYFTGKTLGKHKLAQEVSPGKTWEGMWGGLVCVIIVTAVVGFNLPASYAHLRVESLLLVGLATGGASVLGDLTFSMFKRCSGVKDSGSLLPGHGGLLDRLDSICGAAPVFTLALMLAGY